MEEEKQILFVCAGNAGRSHMAQAIAEKYGVKAIYAGTAASSRMNPNVIEAMREKGIDLGITIPRMVTPEMIHSASLVVTMSCSVGSVLPQTKLAQMQGKLVNWKHSDPQGKSLPCVRRIRDEIEKNIIELSKKRKDLFFPTKLRISDSEF